MKTLRNIAGKFSTGRGMKVYHGHVLASRDAIFMMPHAGLTAVLFDLHLNLAGILERVVESFGKSIADAKGIIATKLDELPREISEDPSWPDTTGNPHIFVLPKACVESMRYPWWGAMEIETAEDIFIITPVFFVRHVVLRNLRELGWEI